MTVRPTRFVVLAIIACFVSGAQAQTHPLEIIRNDKTLLIAPKIFPAEGFTSPDPRIRAVFMEGKPLAGKATRVFAWMGVPKVEAGKKVPAMVLVHGGGGTAFDKWVTLWLDRGYAAIAMDNCGQVPSGTYGKWKRAEQGGPAGWDASFNQTDAPVTDQWAYHAVCDAMLAHSLIVSQEGVDPNRVGLTGISWGGYLTCLIAPADPRLKLAVPVYGCGYIDECVWSKKIESLGDKGKKWLELWDPKGWLKQAKMPILWVTGTNDFAYPFPALQKSYLLPLGERALCIRLRMKHGHGGPGENPAEIGAFADSILKEGDAKGPGLAKITGHGRDAGAAWATFTSRTAVKGAEILYTKDIGEWQKRNWLTAPAKVGDDYRVTAALPEGATVYYFNLIDEHGNVASSEHEMFTSQK